MKQILSETLSTHVIQHVSPIRREADPLNWRQVYYRIKEFRKTNLAPVDSMGCATLGRGSEKNKRFQTLVALMLSPQTRDEMTCAAIQRLRAYEMTLNQKEFNVHTLIDIKVEELEKLVNCVGFYRVKAKNLKKMATSVAQSNENDIPNTLEGLLKLPGVGPKIAHLCLQSAWNKIEGIGVDVHVHRITNRLQWVKTKTPEQTKAALEAILPMEYWADINTYLVGFGQLLCSARSPKCGKCPVADLCPSMVQEKVKVTKSKTIRRKKVTLLDF